jgi:hypothetical protein
MARVRLVAPRIAGVVSVLHRTAAAVPLVADRAFATRPARALGAERTTAGVAGPAPLIAVAHVVVRVLAFAAVLGTPPALLELARHVALVLPPGVFALMARTTVVCPAATGPAVTGMGRSAGTVVPAGAATFIASMLHGSSCG